MIENSSDFRISAFDSGVFLRFRECVLSYSWTPIRASWHKLRSNLKNSKFSKWHCYQHQSFMTFFVYIKPVYPYHFQLILHFLFFAFFLLPFKALPLFNKTHILHEIYELFANSWTFEFSGKILRIQQQLAVIFVNGYKQEVDRSNSLSVQYSLEDHPKKSFVKSAG